MKNHHQKIASSPMDLGVPGCLPGRDIAVKVWAGLLLSFALVSIFTLETAMLASFGGGYQYHKLMTASTAGGVWTVVFCMAVYMVIHSGKQLKQTTS